MQLTKEIILEVAMWVSMYTGVPIGPTEVKQLPPFAMAQVVPECRVALRRGVLLQGLCPVAATYVRETGVVYVASWLPEAETRSWLAHELVHRGQHLAGRPDPASSCEERRAQESEAYAVQNAYHLAHGIEWESIAPEIKCQPVAIKTAS